MSTKNKYVFFFGAIVEYNILNQEPEILYSTKNKYVFFFGAIVEYNILNQEPEIINYSQVLL
jgi:hypothetical protein